MVVGDLVHVVAPRRPPQRLGGVLEFAGLVRVPQCLFLLGPQPGGGGRQYLERVGRAIDVGRHRQAVGPGGQRASVHLIRDDRVLEPERVAVTQVGAVEEPMLGAVHREGARGARHAESVARIAASREGQSDAHGLGPADPPIRPRPREEPFIGCPQHRVFVAAVLEARHRVGVVVEPDLPVARVAAEDRRVAAGARVRVERLAHAPRPVLVVADADERSIPVEHAGLGLQVRADRDIDPVAVALGPMQERAFPVPPSGAAAPHRQAEWLGPLEVPQCLGVGVRLHLAAVRLRLREEPRRHRAPHRDLCGTGVQGRTAPVVVGVVGARREHEQDRRSLAAPRPYDEERLRALVARGQGHRVVPAGPVGDGDLQRDGPAAAVRTRVRRRDVVHVGGARSRARPRAARRRRA